MANHVSSLKRARQTERKTDVNRANKSRVRGSLRALREALQKGDAKSVNRAVSRHRVGARQERAEGHPAQEHRFALQEPAERAGEGRFHQEGVSTPATNFSRPEQPLRPAFILQPVLSAALVPEGRIPRPRRDSAPPAGFHLPTGQSCRPH